MAQRRHVQPLNEVNRRGHTVGLEEGDSVEESRYRKRTNGARKVRARSELRTERKGLTQAGKDKGGDNDDRVENDSEDNSAVNLSRKPGRQKGSGHKRAARGSDIEAGDSVVELQCHDAPTTARKADELSGSRIEVAAMAQDAAADEDHDGDDNEEDDFDRGENNIINQNPNKTLKKGRSNEVSGYRNGVVGSGNSNRSGSGQQGRPHGWEGKGQQLDKDKKADCVDKNGRVSLASFVIFIATSDAAQSTLNPPAPRI